MAVCWSLIESISRWDSNELLKPSINLNHLDLPTKMEIYSHSIDFALLENKTGEITSSRYLTSIVDIVGNYFNISNGALLITNGYALVVIWGKNCFFLFDPHGKNSTGNICQNGTSVLLTFEMLNKLQEYIKEDKLKKKNEDKVKLFKKKILERQYFICTICHQCFH